MKAILQQLAAGRPLTEEQASEAFEAIMSGGATAAQIAALLAMIQVRGATTDEITGAARVMRAKAAALAPPPGLTLVDTCGAGGAGSRFFNISTAAGLVAAAAGRPRGVAVAKHGNRSVTSRSGSSQVLEALGVKLRVAPATLRRCLDEAGFCFFFAPAHHPAIRHAAAVRAELGFATIFNLVAPLTNPAGVRRQVLGVASPGHTRLLSEVLLRLGAEHAMVVHSAWPASVSEGRDSGADGGACVGELTTFGPNRVCLLRGGRIEELELDAASLGLAPGDPRAVEVADPAASAATIRGVLAGRPGPARDLVALNAAAALLVGGAAGDLHEGLQLALEAIDSGAAAGVLGRVADLTSRDPTLAT